MRWKESSLQLLVTTSYYAGSLSKWTRLASFSHRKYGSSWNPLDYIWQPSMSHTAQVVKSLVRILGQPVHLLLQGAQPTYSVQRIRETSATCSLVWLWLLDLVA